MRDTRWPCLFLGLVALGLGMSRAGAQEYGQPPADEQGMQPADEYGTPPAGEPQIGEPQPAQPRVAEPQPAYVAPAAPAPAARRRTILPFGATLTVGGGVAAYAGDTMSDITDVGGAWEVRMNWGTQLPVGVELAYVGTANDIDSVGPGAGLDVGAVLVSNAGELNARLDGGPLLPAGIGRIGAFTWSPFAFGGVAYQRYDLVNEDFNTSDVADSDNVFGIPFGGGVTMTYGRFAVDTRFTYRAAFDEDLIRTPTGDSADVSLDNWAVTAALGASF